jgi:predicted dehydrogenase
MPSKGQKIPPIVVGIIGGGYGISTLLPAIASINDFSVRYIARSRNSNTISDHEDLKNKGILFLSASEIIEDPLVDLVVIACPPKSQEKFAIAALENGKSIFCEKPAGLDLESTKRINATIDSTGGYATIGYQFRYDPLIKWLSSKVSEGSLGKILKVDIEWETSGAMKTPTTSWRNNPEKGGGVLRDFASHIFDYMSVVDPLNFNFHDKNSYNSNHAISSNVLETDIQEIDFNALYGSVKLNCRVSRKIAKPLGHKITIQGDKGVAQVVHKNPFGLTDMSAEFWEGSNVEEKDCTQELNLSAIAEDLEKYNLDLRQLAVRNLFVDLAFLLRGGIAPNLPNFIQGISNQLQIEKVEKALFSSL